MHGIPGALQGWLPFCTEFAPCTPAAKNQPESEASAIGVEVRGYDRLDEFEDAVV